MLVFGNSIRHVAKTFAVFLEDALWEVSELQIKEGSAEFIPACSQKFVWPCAKAGNVLASVGSNMKCLGYHLTCNGDISEQRGRCLGSLRGALAKHRKQFKQANVPSFLVARWWKQQMAGILGFHAGFLTPSQALLSEFIVIENKGTRMVANLHHRLNIVIVICSYE